MSNGVNGNTNFGRQDGVDLRDLFNAQIENLRTLIKANDINYNQRFDNVVAATKNALESADRAVTKSEMASEKRFDAVNEFRATLADQQRTLMPRSEVEILIRGLNDKIDALNVTTIGKQGQSVGMKEGWGWAVGVLGIVVAVVVIISKVIT